MKIHLLYSWINLKGVNPSPLYRNNLYIWYYLYVHVRTFMALGNISNAHFKLYSDSSKYDYIWYVYKIDNIY